MGLSKKRKNELLDKLRDLNPSYEKTVLKSIATIDKADLCDPNAIRIFAERCGQLRMRNGLSQQDLGEQLGVSHTIIGRLETPPDYRSQSVKMSESIDKHYLEMLSLFFQVSPLYLIGKTDSTGDYILGEPKEPMYEIEPKIRIRAQLITLNLCKDPVKRELLLDFIKICDAKRSWMKEIKCHLFSTPHIAEMINSKFEFEESDATFQTYLDQVHEDWRDFCLSDISFHNRFGCCFNLLCDFGLLNFELLDVFAHISFDDAFITALHNWLHDSGFLTQQNNFRQFIQFEQVANKCVGVSVSMDYSFVTGNGNHGLGRIAPYSVIKEK